MNGRLIPRKKRPDLLDCVFELWSYDLITTDEFCTVCDEISERCVEG